MRKYGRKWFMFGSGLILSIGASAIFAASKNQPPFRLMGTTFVTIKTSKLAADGTPEQKTISLLKIVPSDEFTKKKKEILRNMRRDGLEQDYSKGIVSFDKSPGAVDLGMSNVPVLDQGQYGTCVTFATTAAMDAALNAGDFISQQCALELTTALGNNYWDGAYFSAEIIEPLKSFGLVQQNKCNAIYPNRYATITLSGYSLRIDKNITAKNIQYNYYSTLSLDNVRQAIRSGHRVTVGFGLIATQDPMSVQGFDVTVDGLRTAGGLWACSQNSSFTDYCTGTPNAGHEVVITGFDDTQELLKVRNSWGTFVGDQGDYYMTYSYFTRMNGDGTEIK